MQKQKLILLMHLAFDEPLRFYAGNIYLKKRQNKWIPTVNFLLSDIATDKKIELTSFSRAIAIEINVPCDHAQQKMRIPRFLGGLIVPASKLPKDKKHAEYFSYFWSYLFRLKIIPARQVFYYLLIETSNNNSNKSN